MASEIEQQQAEQPDEQAQTFLFADLAGFTALTEVHGDEQAADLVGAFCQQARRLLPEHEAEEIKAIGDALMIRVPHAEQAIRLALRLAHEVGGQHGFPAVRVGLHTGPAVQREQDWFGATVNLAARVSTAAAAGEVLTTAATRDAAAPALPELDFRSRGEKRFKNVSAVVEIFAVARAGEQAPSRQVIDPVCQMALDPGRAVATRGEGDRQQFFCSTACAESFDRSPTSFVSRRSRRAELLASDGAREQALALLRTAYQRGRLSTEELEERMAHAHAARTRGELSAILRDLPEYRRWRRGSRRRRRWRGLLPWRRRGR